jgi:alkylation response protein AidB-like acyl-CoA dehydrogenase
MNFSRIDTDEPDANFRTEVREFLSRHLTPSVISCAEASGDGIDREFHRELGKLGWVTPCWSREVGGAGLSRRQGSILAAELMGAEAPHIVHRTTLTVASVVKRWAAEDVAAEALSRVPSGDTLMCLGYTEPDAGSDLAAASTRAIFDGDSWVLQGQKMFTTGAHLSSFCLLLARSDPDVERHAGLTTFLVPMDRPGITITPIRTFAGERTNLVFYDEVHLEDRYRLGPVNSGWAVVSEPLAVEHAQATDDDHFFPSVTAFYVNDLRRLLMACLDSVERSAGYDERALTELLGAILLEIEIGTALPGPMGRISTAESFIRTSTEAIQALAPGALVADGGGPRTSASVEALHRFAQGTSIYGGTTEIFRNMLSRELIGSLSGR